MLWCFVILYVASGLIQTCTPLLLLRCDTLWYSAAHNISAVILWDTCGNLLYFMLHLYWYKPSSAAMILCNTVVMLFIIYLMWYFVLHLIWYEPVLLTKSLDNINIIDTAVKLWVLEATSEVIPTLFCWAIAGIISAGYSFGCSVIAEIQFWGRDNWQRQWQRQWWQLQWHRLYFMLICYTKMAISLASKLMCGHSWF